jgi:2-amino-4-hydroxy-6-hydroxymethyldihydropteridine diphosphokinase
MTRYAVALGSNLGDRAGTLRSALVDISRFGEIAAVSGLYETMPIGGPEQDPFLNAVVVIDSALGPEALLAGLGAVEDSHGRVRAERWGPRTLDLDIVSSEGPVIDNPRLQVPHSRAHERRFVLEPLAEIWPEAPVGNGVTAEMAMNAVLDQEVELLLRHWDDPERSLGIYWVMAQLLLFVVFAIALIMDGSLPGTSADPLNIVGGGPDGWRIVGAVLLVGGGVGLVVAVRSLGRALTAMPEPLAGVTLIESGSYRYVRHPIYGAILLLSLGASLLFTSTAGNLMCVALAAFFWTKSSYEERRLRVAYPLYSGYRRRVTKRFIPFLV